MGERYFTEERLADVRASTVPADASRVNVHDDSEVEYWCRKFGVAAAQLLAAVAKVGDLARRVETELKRR